MQARKLAKTDQHPFQLSLRIRHPSIDPAELSREFQIEADHSYRAGDPRPLRNSTSPLYAHIESYWLGALDPSRWPPDFSFPGNPKLQLAAENMQAAVGNSFSWALALGTRTFFHRHAALLRRIKSEGGEVSLLAVLAAREVGSFSLPPEVGRALGEFGVTLEVEFTDH